MKNSVLDTSPKIAEYGYLWDRGRENKVINANYGISEIYEYPSQSFKQTLVSMGLDGGKMCNLYKDGVFVDWWGQATGDPDYATKETERDILNAGSNQITCSIELELINTTYAYIKETGQILFAGKNTIYYGHRNISELN